MAPQGDESQCFSHHKTSATKAGRRFFVPSRPFVSHFMIFIEGLPEPDYDERARASPIEPALLDSEFVEAKALNCYEVRLSGLGIEVDAAKAYHQLLQRPSYTLRRIKLKRADQHLSF